MGLLDGLMTDDARMGIGLLAAGSYSPTRKGFGERLNTALSGEDARRLEELKKRGLLAQIDAESKLTPLKIALQQAEVEKTKQEAAKMGRVNTFYDPANVEKFMEGARPAVPPVAAEAGGVGPSMPAQPGLLNFDRFLPAAAAAGAIDPERLAAHQSTIAQSKAQLAALNADRNDKLMQRYYEADQKTQDRQAQIEAANQRNRESIQAANERAQQANDLRRDMVSNQRNKDLKPGERFNSDGSIEVIPGSAEFVRRSNLHAKDYSAVQGIDTKTDNAIRKLDFILDEKNKGAFNSNFGGYNALLTQHLPFATQDVKANIESIKSDLKMAGLEMARAGGSIGAMTEREWPFVERALANITPMLSEEQARNELNAVRSQLERIRNTAKDAYQTEWSQTQFYKPVAGEGNTRPSLDNSGAPIKRVIGGSDYDRLPSGSTYIAPDGSKRRKP